MDKLVDFLVQYGDPGMFIASLLSGSIGPFISSEAVLVALLAVGVGAWGLLLWSSVGNIIGGYICYRLGTIATPAWLQRNFHIKPEKMIKAKRFIDGHGTMASFFSWIPLLGSAILVVMGMMHSKPLKTLLWMSIGKFVRYLIIVLPFVGFTWMKG